MSSTYVLLHSFQAQHQPENLQWKQLGLHLLRHLSRDPFTSWLLGDGKKPSRRMRRLVNKSDKTIFAWEEGRIFGPAQRSVWLKALSSSILLFWETLKNWNVELVLSLLAPPPLWGFSVKKHRFLFPKGCTFPFVDCLSPNSSHSHLEREG